MLINKSNGTNCKYVCKLYVGALVSEHQTNQSSLKIQENQKEIHEPNSIKSDYSVSLCQFSKKRSKKKIDKELDNISIQIF